MRTAYQGEPGAFSEAAARALVRGADPYGYPSFREALEAVTSGACGRAVLPVENTVFGSVPEVLDGLVNHADRSGLRVTAERWERVELALMALPGTALSEVRSVHSHPQALGQAAAWLNEHLPGAARLPDPDTAGAAARIAREGRGEAAAIASRRAAELYGLTVLAPNVEDDARNYTRFLLVEPAGAAVSVADKSSLVLTPSEQVPNALFRALTAFVGRRLAVLRVEPRPRLGRPGQYHYHLDVEGNASADPLSAAITDASAFCDRVLVLGSYRAEPPK
jgi:prephenate dehydratase